MPAFRPSRVIGCALAFALVQSSVAPAFAQAPSAVDVAQARELFNDGLTLRDKGDNAGAIDKLQAANALAHTPITALELGRTYINVGKLVEAREVLLSVARLPEQPLESARSKAARKESAQLAESLRPRLAKLTVAITGVASDSVSVTIDGAAVPAQALAAPRLVDPGDHDIAAVSTAGGHAETKVHVAEGEERHVELRIVFAEGARATAAGPAPAPAAPAPLAPAPPETPPATSQSRGNGQRIAGIAVGAAGIVAMGAGGVLGLMGKSEYNKAASETYPARESDSTSAVHLGTAGTILLGVGAAATVAGVVVWLTAPRAPVTVGTTGTTLLVRYTF